MSFQGERKLQGEIGENFAKVKKEPEAGWSLQQPGPHYSGGPQWRWPSSGDSGCVECSERGAFYHPDFQSWQNPGDSTEQRVVQVPLPKDHVGWPLIHLLWSRWTGANRACPVLWAPHKPSQFWCYPKARGLRLICLPPPWNARLHFI